MTIFKRSLRVALSLTFASATFALATAGPAEAQQSGCPSVGGDFAGEGPFGVEEEATANHTFFSPQELGSQGCTSHPVVLWGNGTAAPTSVYAGYLRHLASHGFIVVAGNSVMAGAGGQMLEGLDLLEQRAQDSGDRFYQMVSDMVGTTGHSQGGGASIASGKDPRVDAIFPFEPWLQNENGLTAASLFLGGENDSVVWPDTVRARFDGVGNSIPAAYAELAGATHFTALGDMGGFRGPTTAFARWQLMGDSEGGTVMAGLGSDPAWSEYETNVLWDALPAGGSGGGDTGGGDEPPPDDGTGGEPPAEDCSFLAELLGLCGGDGGDTGGGEAPPPEEGEDCSFLGSLFGLC